MDSIDLKRNADRAGMDDDSDDLISAKSKHLAKEKQKASMARQCPYLDTIDRNVLDFGKFISFDFIEYSSTKDLKFGKIRFSPLCALYVCLYLLLFQRNL